MDTHIGLSITRKVCGYGVISQTTDGSISVLSNGVVHLERLGDTPLDILRWLVLKYKSRFVYVSPSDKHFLVKRIERIERMHAALFRWWGSLQIFGISPSEAYVAGENALKLGYPVLARASADLVFDDAFSWYDSVRALCFAFAGMWAYNICSCF